MGQHKDPERHDFVEEGATYSLTEGSKCGRCQQHEDDKVHDPATKARHVIVGSGSGYGGVYGIGTTLEQAKQQFRREGGRLGKYHRTFEFPDGVTFLGITGLGTVRWRYDTDPHVEPVIVDVHKGK